MKKIKIYVFFLFVIANFNAYANEPEFEEWKEKFKLIALERGVSQNTIETVSYTHLTLPTTPYV